MTIARRGERWALTRTDDVCEAGGVEEIIAAKWVAEETIWVVRNFVAEGESENTYNPRMCPWVGKVVDYDEDEDCARNLPHIIFGTSTMVTKSGCLQKKSIITGLAQSELRCSAEQSPRAKTVANAA